MTRSKASKKNNALLGSLKVSLREFRVPSGTLFRVATDLYEALDTPISLSCEILLRYGETKQLLSKTVDPGWYQNAFRFRDDYQAVSFLRKCPIPAPGVDPELAAKEKFFEAEERCRETNARLRSFVANPNKASAAVKAIIPMAAAEVQRILGSCVDSREWLYACRFGPGAFNHSEARGLTSLYDKLQVRPSVSHEMEGLGALLVMSQPQWARSVTDIETPAFWPIINRSHLDVVPGNRIAFVPKTAITHRTIAIEPLLNVYAQLGLGKLIRRRLLRSTGIDLDQQEPNQVLAKVGSIDGSLATIDLSSASDTIAREFVRFMLPDSWFHVLDMTRSKFGLLDGKWIRYEKFSSMGNGFTFELETLLFWSLAHSVNRYLELSSSQSRVYGDDIIVPVQSFALLKEVLEYCGFTLNQSKSYDSGPFRESCGKDYYNGIDVRPFLQKEYPSEIQHLFRLANGLRMLAYRRNSRLGCDLRLLKPWSTTVRAIPRSISLHLRVPSFAGDSDGIKSNWDESQASSFVVSNSDGWEGVSGPRYQSTPLQVRTANNMLGAIAAMLYRLKDEDTLPYLKESSVSSPPRLGRDYEYRLVTRAFYGPWTDFGPWQ